MLCKLQLLYKPLFAFAVLVMVLCSADSYGQVSGRGNDNPLSDNQKVVSDTSGFAEKAEDNSVIIFYKNDAGKRSEYDTAIIAMHQLGLLNNWELDLGNTGGAYQSVRAQVTLPVEYTLLPNAQNSYRFLKSNLRFFNTTKPFSEVRYSMGSGSEQVMELFHTQNIKPHWNFSTRYRKINSQGFYKAQKNNIDNFNFVSHYVSPKQRYKIHGAILYNKIQQDENFGITSDSLLGERGYNRGLIPVVMDVANGVTRSAVLNYNRDVNATIVQSYSLGKESITYDADSIKLTNFKPFVTFENEVYIKNVRYCFQHNSPDSTFQATYFDYNYGIDADDTLILRYENAILGTSIAAEGTIYFNEKIFSAKGGLGIEYQQVGGTAITRQSINNYIFGELTNRKSLDSSWQVDANFKLYYTGMARGNLNLEGRLSKKLSDRLGTISIDASQYVQQPFYVSESIQINNSIDSETFGAQSNTQIGGTYSNPKLKLSAGLHNLLFNNLIYSEGLQPNFKQWKPLINVLQVSVGKDFSFKKWTITNKVLYQLTGKNMPIQVPAISSFHRFAYSSALFKKKLAIQAGIDMQYASSYYIDAYQPIFQSFAPQYTYKQTFVPRLQPFFNFKIKKFRAAFSFDQVQHYFSKNNYNYINHPAQNPNFRFGLSWIFVN